MKHGKKYVDSAKLIDHLNAYDPAEACELACKTSKAKFDETIEISVRLGVDPRHADQQVRGRGGPAAWHRPHCARAGGHQGRQGQGSRGRGCDFVGGEKWSTRSRPRAGSALT